MTLYSLLYARPGLPTSTAPAGSGSPGLSGNPYLPVSADAIRNNFDDFGQLDVVRFIVEWFSETSPTAAVIYVP